MNDTRIDTPHGVTLTDTLQLPTGAAPIDLEVSTTSEDTQPLQIRPKGVVLLAHDFLTDRHGQSGRLDWIGTRYREADLATLNLDFSGLGGSDDDVVTLAGEAEDLRTTSSWLAGLSFTRQMIHADGFKATAALLARPEHMRTAVLVGAIMGPQSILWEEIFSPEQLDELAQHGLTYLVDDNPDSREWNILSKETLTDFSVQDPQRTLAGLPQPVLVVRGVLSNELPDTAEATAGGFLLLPDFSQMVHVHAKSLEQAQEEVAHLSIEWARHRLR